MLLALVQAGMARDDAYRIVQIERGAVRGTKASTSAPLLEAIPRWWRSIAAVLDEAFDLDRVAAHARRSVDALDALEI